MGAMLPWFEILDANGKILKRFRKIVSELEFENELMVIPEMTLTLPDEYEPYLMGRKQMRIHLKSPRDGKNRVFRGWIDTISPNGQIAVDVTVRHAIREWEFRQVPTNYAVKAEKISTIYTNEDMYYSPDWTLAYGQDADLELIDYVYSRQSMLEALNQTVEMTSNVFWRVAFDEDKKIEISAFGEKKPYQLSYKPSTERNIRIVDVSRPEIDHSSVMNVATVYSNETDGGMTSLTLREVYNDKSLQDPNFPVVILRSGINNERDYDYEEYPEIAPNEQLEYAVLDKEGIALESGLFIEGAIDFNDYSPFSIEEGSETAVTGTLRWVIPENQRSLEDPEMINNAQCMYGFFKAEGWTDESICALIGCCGYESGCNPNAWQGYSPTYAYNQGFGLVQWTPWSNITDWLGARGYSVQQYGNAECEKIQEELENGEQWIPTYTYPMSFREWTQQTTTDFYELCNIWLYNYGRGSAASYYTVDQRAQFAQYCYNLIQSGEWKGTYPLDGDGTGILQEGSTTNENEGTEGEEPLWNPQAFIDKWNGQSTDIDGVFGNQCVDLFKEALAQLGYPNPAGPIGGDGYAWSIWYNRTELGYDPYFDFYTTAPKEGDWTIFAQGGMTPLSHVAMFVSSNGDGTSQYFGQNQPNPYCDIQTISDATVLGYMRVKEKYWTSGYPGINSKTGKEITNEDRIYAATVVYHAVIKKLKNSRPTWTLNVVTEELPSDLNVGDQILCKCGKDKYYLDACSNYMRKLLTIDDWFYITRIKWTVRADGLNLGELQLEKFIRIERETKDE